MKASRDMLVRIVLIAAIAVITSVIFINSFADIDSSHQSSGAVAQVIAPSAKYNVGNIELIIRKAAHVIEYAVLGITVAAFIINIKKAFGKSFFGASLFYTLAVAVADEHIQSYSDRTSSTGDIMLDFCGAVIGFFVGWLVIKIYTYIKRRIKKSDKAGGQS